MTTFNSNDAHRIMQEAQARDRIMQEAQDRGLMPDLAANLHAADLGANLRETNLDGVTLSNIMDAAQEKK